MSNQNLPTEPGLYWASEHSMLEDWELIAKIKGQVPFLQCSVWKYLGSQKIADIHKVEKLYFGPKIEIPKRDPRARPLGSEDIVT